MVACHNYRWYSAVNVHFMQITITRKVQKVGKRCLHRQCGQHNSQCCQPINYTPRCSSPQQSNRMHSTDNRPQYSLLPCYRWIIKYFAQYLTVIFYNILFNHPPKQFLGRLFLFSSDKCQSGFLCWMEIIICPSAGIWTPHPLLTTAYMSHNR